jgi:uncharacterized protein (TIGR00251 family)
VKGVAITIVNGGVRFSVRVQPRASRTEIAGEYGTALKVRLQSPPVDGAANEELVDFLARRLGVSRSGVRIVSGHSSRTKTVEVVGVTTMNIQDLANKSGGA